MYNFTQQKNIHSSVVVIVSVDSDDDDVVAFSLFLLGSNSAVVVDSFSDVAVFKVAFVTGISDDDDDDDDGGDVDSSFFGPFVRGFGSDLFVTLLGLPKCIIDIR